MLLVLLICACEPEPTPLPSVLPTAQPTQGVDQNATPAPLRYALAPSALMFLTETDRSLITASAEIVPLDSPPADVDFGARYDFVVSLSNDLPASTNAPTPLQISLLIDNTLPPLDNPQLAALIQQIVDSETEQRNRALVFTTHTAPTPIASTIREQLANAGYPDGFDLTLASPFNAEANALAELFAVYGIETRLVAAGEPAHLTLTNLPTAPSADAVLLYTLPLSYRAVDGLTITFTPSGFPIASR